MNDYERTVKIYDAILKLQQSIIDEDPKITKHHIIIALGDVLCGHYIAVGMTKDKFLHDLGEQFVELSVFKKVKLGFSGNLLRVAWRRKNE